MNLMTVEISNNIQSSNDEVRFGASLCGFFDGCAWERERVFVVADKNLRGYYGCFDGCEIIEIEASEERKTLEVVTEIVAQLVERGADRDSLLVGFGGGITTDIVGFVASIYRRGIAYALIPTTLLAQVDAAVGGKNGVNFCGYKNMVGCISSPATIYICTEVLETLDSREFRAGVAEILKIFMIYDVEFYAKAVELFASMDYSKTAYLGDRSLLDSVIRRSVECKLGVVARDRNEKGERRLLNLGHTFGHALERKAVQKGLDIVHGEAVAIGMVVAARVAERLDGRDSQFSKRVAEDLQRVGLPCELPGEVKIEELFEAVAKDKKVSGEDVYFILPFEIGRVEQRKLNLKALEELFV